MHGEVVDEFAVVVRALWSGQYRSVTPRDLKVILSLSAFDWLSARFGLCRCI